MDGQLFPQARTTYLDTATWWIASDELGPCGYAGAVMMGPEEPHTLYLCRAGLRRRRGQGIQRGFIRARLAWGRKQGAKDAITYTWYRNHASARSLIACGFRPYDPEYAYVGRAEWIYWQRGV